MGAGRAIYVHPVLGAEPKIAAPLAYLQKNLQIHHVVSPKAVCSPAESSLSLYPQVNGSPGMRTAVYRRYSAKPESLQLVVLACETQISNGFDFSHTSGAPMSLGSCSCIRDIVDACAARLEVPNASATVSP